MAAAIDPRQVADLAALAQEKTTNELLQGILRELQSINFKLAIATDVSDDTEGE